MKVTPVKYLASSLLLLLLVGMGVAASASSIVVNGTFSTPASSSVSWGTLAPGGGSVGGPGTVTWGSDQYGYDPTNINGWTFSPLTPGASGSGIADQGSAFGFTPPPSGASQVAFLQMGQPGTLSSVSQTITGLIAGDQYVLTFSLEGRPGMGGAVTSVTIGSTTLLSDVVPGDSEWTTYDELFTAAGTTEILDFFSTAYNGQDSTTAIDDPQIVSTPEPESLLLLGTGLFGLALVVFRKAKRSGMTSQS